MSGLERFKSHRDKVKPRAVVPTQRKCFVVVPCMWANQLLQSKHVVTYKVAHHLLYEASRTRESVVQLSTVALAGKNISKASKNRALSELKHLGLVEVERHPRRSPLVRMLHID